MYCFETVLKKKETVLAYDRAKEQSQKGKSEKLHVAPLETDAETLASKPQPRGHTQII